MGYVNTEQVAIIIEETAEAIAIQPEPETNYYWLLLIAVIPVLIGYYLKRKK